MIELLNTEIPLWAGLLFIVVVVCMIPTRRRGQSWTGRAPEVEGSPPTCRERPVVEGRSKKGGINQPPTTPKPDIHPVGQGVPSKRVTRTR